MESSEIKNKLILGDNIDVLKTLESESVDLVYIDPPFFSNKNYEVVFGDEAEIRSFEDRWEGGVNVYIEWMRERVKELHRLLKTTGSLYLHCDWHASHHLRIMLDEIFGANNFRNEIIWHYKKWSIKQVQFCSNHDTIFFYSKTDDKKRVFNHLYMERAASTLKRFGNAKIVSGYDDEGSRLPSKTEDKNSEGVPMDDVWDIGRVPPIKQLYPTEKPIKLLERIIQASSNKGDIVLDAFCGCGTTLSVAQSLGRHWIGIDISPTAIKLIEKRLSKLGAKKGVTYTAINTPTTENDLRALKPFEFQNWVIDELEAKHSKRNVGDMGLDGYFEKDLWHEEAGIQVKQSDSVGRNVVDNFETALKRADYKKGYIVGFSFGKGAYEEAAREKKEGIEIKLIKVLELLDKKKPIL